MDICGQQHRPNKKFSSCSGTQFGCGLPEGSYLPDDVASRGEPRIQQGKASIGEEVSEAHCDNFPEMELAALVDSGVKDRKLRFGGNLTGKKIYDARVELGRGWPKPWRGS